MTPGIQAWRFVCFFNFRTKKRSTGSNRQSGKDETSFQFSQKNTHGGGGPIGVGK